MLVIAIAVAGLIWHRDVVQESVMNQLGGLVGAQGAEFVSGLLESASNPADGIMATIIGIITLLFGVSASFITGIMTTIFGLKKIRK